MPLSFHDFCFVFSLQAGVVATSTIGFTIMMITFIFNIYAPNSMETKVQIGQYISLYIYLLVMMTAFGMAFMASFWEKPKLIKISAIILGVGTFFYLILSILSYIREGDVMTYVCPEMRCPDHHWLQDSRWRAVYIAMESEKQGNEESSTPEQQENDHTPTEPIARAEDVSNRTNPQMEFADKENRTKPERPTKKTREKDVLILMFVSFVYSTSFLVYYVYTLLTLLAFAAQIENGD